MTVPVIAVTEPAGPAGTPLVVLGPSLGNSSLLWGGVIALLARTHRVVAWDLPGHGDSPPAAEPFTVAELADAVAGIAERTGEPVHYAGVSLGGAVGLELALRHPERVRSLAVIASGAKLGDPDGWAERAAAVRATSTSSLITASAGRWFAPGSMQRIPELAGRLLHVLQDADDESYALCCEALAGYDVRDRLHRIGAPVRVLWGEHDQATPEATARVIADGVPGASLGRIDGAAHLPPAEQPDAVAAALHELFSRQEGR